MQIGDLVQHNSTREIGIVKWINKEGNIIDIRIQDLRLGHKYRCYQDIRQYTVIGDYRW